jgi:hypothetical protein
VATARKAPKKTAIDHVKALGVDSSTSIPAGRSTTIDADTANDDSDNDRDSQQRTMKKRKKGDGSADILTIFERVNPDDITQGYKCKLCA